MALPSSAVEAARHVLGDVAAGRPVPWSAVEMLLGAVLRHDLVAPARSVERGLARSGATPSPLRDQRQPARLAAKNAAAVNALRWEIDLLFRELRTVYRLNQMPTSSKSVTECLLCAALLTLAVSRRLHRAFNRCSRRQHAMRGAWR